MPETTTMHTDFPRWYRAVSVEENRNRLQGRWNGVASILPTLDQSTVENLLRIVFHAKNAPTTESAAKLRQSFKAADDLFDMQGNDRELEVLCGVILAVLLERNDDLSAWAAVAITTSLLGGKRTLQLPMDLNVLAENAISRIAEKNRVRPDLKTARLELPKLVFTKAKEKITAMDAASLGSAFDAAAESINLTLATMVKKFNSAVDATADFVAIQDEELEMLWWVLGERSNDLKKTFSKLTELERPLVFGAELAQATVYLPGPLSVQGLLIRGGLKADEKFTIPQIVNACEKEWLDPFVNGEAISPLLQPIHFAIQRKLETGDETSWVSGWAASSSLEATVAFPSVLLGLLFYRERLLSIF